MCVELNCCFTPMVDSIFHALSLFSTFLCTKEKAIAVVVVVVTRNTVEELNKTDKKLSEREEELIFDSALCWLLSPRSFVQSLSTNLFFWAVDIIIYAFQKKKKKKLESYSIIELTFI